MAQPDLNILTASMTNTANGLRNAAAEMDNATTEISKIQHTAAADIVRQLARMQVYTTGSNRTESTEYASAVYTIVCTCSKELWDLVLT